MGCPARARAEAEMSLCAFVFARCPLLSRAIGAISKGLDEALPSCVPAPWTPSPGGEVQHGRQELGGSAPWSWESSGLVQDVPGGMGRWVAAQGGSLEAHTLFWHSQGVASSLITD